MEYVSIPVIQFRPKRLLLYTQTLHYNKDGTTPINYARHEISKERTYSGDMTKGSVKRIRLAMSYLLAISPNQFIYNPVTQKQFNFRLSLITLTLSAQLDRKDEVRFCAEVFRPFLLLLRRKYGVKDYIWKVERQGKTQNLHWHITTNRFIQHDKLRREWNEYQNRFGLVDRFKAVHGHNNPNSTDIHSVKKVHDLEAYIGKYISKISNDDSQKISGKVWDCSKNLKGIKNVSKEMESQHYSLVNEALKMKGTRVIKCDQCDIITMSESNYSKLIDKYKVNEYTDLIRLLSQ